jgi:hypothetical protein
VPPCAIEKLGKQVGDEKGKFQVNERHEENLEVTASPRKRADCEHHRSYRAASSETKRRFTSLCPLQ